MAEALTIPRIEDQHAFNLARWSELGADSGLASLDYRIETDRFGHILMSPPPAFEHSDFQGRIQEILRDLMNRPGRARPEAPISTMDGVKAADVVWISEERLKISLRHNVLLTAPEICVEVLSPSNTLEEIEEKKRLYFEAGAEEVWICDLKGTMRFYLKRSPPTPAASHLCPAFPNRLN